MQGFAGSVPFPKLTMSALLITGCKMIIAITPLSDHHTLATAVQNASVV
jgi:hypothetical protein